MKKVLYSMVTKLMAMLCILVSTGIILSEVISIAKWDYEVDENYNNLYDEYVDYSKIYDDVYGRIRQNVETLINIHKESGMEAMCNFYYNNMVGDMLMVAVDNQYMYRYGLALTATKEGDYNYIYNYFWGDYLPHIYIEDQVELLIYDKEEGLGPIIDIQELSEHLSKDTVEYLASIDYSLLINIEVNEDFYYEVESGYLSMLEGAVEEDYDGTLEEQIYDRIPVFAVCGVVILVATVLLLISCGRILEGKKDLNYYEKGYSEIHLGIIIALAISLLFGVAFFFNEYYYLMRNVPTDCMNWIDCGFIAVVLAGVLWLYYEIGIILKKLINKRFLKDLLIIRILFRIKGFITKHIKKNIVKLKNVYDSNKYSAASDIKRMYKLKKLLDISMVMCAFIALVVALLMSPSAEVLLLLYFMSWIFVTVHVGMSIFEYMYLRKYNKITKAVDTIHDGNYLDLEIDENESCQTLVRLGNMSNSFEESVRKQVEAEKTQIELVANVSHDLKTPLTSIISYVDLLKEEEMSDAAKDYVNALVEKSAKLKDIVADVFDLAKATSGEQVSMEKLDGVVLVNQVLSDMSNVIEESGKDFKVRMQGDTAPIMGNGQKLYRAFQNVIDNALRYSMSGTRIYLSAKMVGKEFVVTLKNVSQYEMDFSEEEIMSRFSRNDRERHSEGNGLGMSIAKSFTELCGGHFEIKLDGDIFIVIISLR